MIKAQATLRGTISHAATLRSDKEGRNFLCFDATLTIPASRNNMAGMTVTVSISTNGTEADIPRYAVGSRIEATGLLTFRKRNDNLYLNFHADTITMGGDGKDALEGTLEFKGTVGNKLEVKTDKKGRNFLTFSAFSTEKANDVFQFTWVRFIRFDSQGEPWLQAKSKVEAKGTLLLTAYNGRLNIDCRIDEMKPWERTPYASADANKDDTPF